MGGGFGLEYAAAGLWGQLVDREHGLLFNNAVALAAIPGFWFLFSTHRRAAVYLSLVALSIYVFHAFFKLWYVSHPGWWEAIRQRPSWQKYFSDMYDDRLARSTKERPK